MSHVGSMADGVSVAGVLLAAGGGRRFGGPKALALLHGELLVERGIRLLRAGGCTPVVVVLGAQAETVRSTLSGPRDAVEVVVAPDWETGMGASLRAGLAAIAPGPAGACVVALADQPLVGAEAVARLIAAWGAEVPAVVATYGGKPRNPVLLDRSVWSAVAEAAVGDSGARGWLRAHPEQVTDVACDDTGSPYDIDTPDDLAAIAAGATMEEFA